MGKISFETEETEARILNPLKGFAEERHRIEVRKDPLLGHKSVYNARLKEKVTFFFGRCDDQLVQEMVASSAKTCPFCPTALIRELPNVSDPSGRRWRYGYDSDGNLASVTGPDNTNTLLQIMFSANRVSR